MHEKISSRQIRETFLNFFKSKNHFLIPNTSLLPKNDPTLLYINSGMAPLKKYFLGLSKPPHPRLCNVQLCVRTGDIEDAGDRHHFTSFEMLGSWSINDYYKETAIELAYELLVEKFGFPVEKLYATVYAGDLTLNLPPDKESMKIWERVGLQKDHIIMLGEDNFWGPAGNTGPCGPCTEVFYDTGDEYGESYETSGIFDTTNRYIEIWNAGVFMELDKKPDGSFERLSLKSVDTGSGLERMEMVLNNCNSLYDTDLIRPIMGIVEQQLSNRNSSVEDYKIISDHLKTAIFILTEGVLPSNEGQGYIPRRLIRKCTALITRAGAVNFDYDSIVNQVADIYEDYYPNLRIRQSQTIAVLEKEVKDFEQTIKKGLDRLDSLLPDDKSSALSGKNTFELVTTYGVPLELIQLFAQQRGIKVDKDDYMNYFRRHQEVSRQGLKAETSSKGKVLSQKNVKTLIHGVDPTVFEGYETSKSQGEILALLKNGMKVKTVNNSDEILMLIHNTPFYAESGGQIGDTGIIVAPNGKAEVLNTTKIDDIFIHHTKILEGTINIGDTVILEVDEIRRKRLKANHSATHLLHSALRNILGESVTQKGSLVASDRLRFDFQYSSPLTDNEIIEVEKLVNSWIWSNLKADTKTMNYEEAISNGCLALFSEKYGDLVRVLEIGDVSRELCGGIHVNTTGEIGMFLIVSEGSIAKGIRRIEAVTGEIALKSVQNKTQILKEASKLLKTSQSKFLNRLENIVSSNASDKKNKVPFSQSLTVKGEKKSLKCGVDVFGGRLDNADSKILKEEASTRISKDKVDVICLVGADNDTARIVVIVDPSFSNRLNAGHLLNELLPFIDGKGGGKAQFAQGGGKDTEGIDILLKNLPILVEQQLKPG